MSIAMDKFLFWVGKNLPLYSSLNRLSSSGSVPDTSLSNCSCKLLPHRLLFECFHHRFKVSFCPYTDCASIRIPSGRLACHTRFHRNRAELMSLYDIMMDQFAGVRYVFLDSFHDMIVSFGVMCSTFQYLIPSQQSDSIMRRPPVSIGFSPFQFGHDTCRFAGTGADSLREMNV